MSALRNDSDKQGRGDVLNYIIYQNTLEMMRVQGGKAHKKDLCKGGKMQSAFSEGLPLLKGTADGSQCLTRESVAAVWGHMLILGAMATADLYTAPARLQQLVSNFWECERVPELEQSQAMTRAWNRGKQGELQLEHPAPACPVTLLCALMLCTQQLLSWGRQCWQGAGDVPTRGPLGAAGGTHSAPVPSPSPASTHQKHPCTAAPGPCRNPS